MGLPHQRIHAQFIHSVVGGEYVTQTCGVEHSEFRDEIFDRDGKDAIWFFNDLYFNLHPRLKGKQVLIRHGMSFKVSMNPKRADCINRHIDLVFETGMPNEYYALRGGVDPGKIRRIGFTTLFEIPHLPPEPSCVLFSSVYFTNWNQDANLMEILRRLDPRLKGYVSCHPETPERTQQVYRRICEDKPNLEYFQSQEDLLRSAARCQFAVCGVGTVSTLFWYQRKPVIFIRGSVGTNPFKGTGWSRIKKETGYPLFSEILDQSPKLSHWRQFDLDFLGRAKWCPESEKIFYPSNHDKELTIEKIRQAVGELRSP